MNIMPYVLVFAAGLGIGVYWPASDPPPPVQAASSAVTAPPTTPTTPRIVCTDVAKPRERELDALLTRLNWCEARLRNFTAPRPTGRIDWPTGIPDVESPDTWAEDMDTLASNCNIPGTPIVTDCEEYPCVTLMRPVGHTITGRELRQRLNNCDALPPSLAATTIEAAPIPINCPDGTREDAIVISGASQAGVEAVYNLEENEVPEFSQYVVHAGRRVESALALWTCGSAGD